MNIEDVKKALEESLSIELQSSSAWSPPDTSRTNYLEQRLQELRESMVEPYPIEITPSATACKYGDWEQRPYQMFVVANHDREDMHVLFLNTETELFSLGHIDTAGKADIIGFASKDALAEWID